VSNVQKASTSKPTIAGVLSIVACGFGELATLANFVNADFGDVAFV